MKKESSPSEKDNYSITQGEVVDIETGSSEHVSSHTYTVKRTLTARNLQLIALGGSVGTALLITISNALYTGGPLSLFLAFFLWSFIVLFVTVAMGEMVCYLPIEAPFIQMAGRCVDDAYEFIVGYNYWLMSCIYIPFEITAVNAMIHFWTDDYSPAITFVIQIVIYTGLNLMAVKYFGESEFYLSIGKVILMVALIFFTFITMVGGNPEHDAFGFRYWRSPYPLMVESYATGNLGRFQGFLSALNKACLTIVGPEYLSMIAGEAGQETRKVLARTFKTVFYRLLFFYVLGALCVGILLPANDPTLAALLASGSTSDASYSPYVIAMKNLNIKVFPNIVNALCISSAFSAGNSYVFCSSRALLGIAERGLAPKIFKRCTKNGVPIYCVAVSFCFSLLSLLQLSNGSSKVLNWMINISTGCQLLNYFYMCVTYLCFYRACKAQGIDRDNFIFKAWYQPYLTIFAMCILFIMVFILGYTVFLPGYWSIDNFLTYYIMIFIEIAMVIGYKLIYRTKPVRPEDADLISGLEEIELHEQEYLASLPRNSDGTVKKNWLQKVNDFLF